MKILFMLIPMLSANVFANTNVNMMAHVNEHRESITLNLKNKVTHDYFCESISVSINYENPMDYSFHTEVIKNVKSIYAKSGEISSKVVAQQLTDEMRGMFATLVIIRDARINLEDTFCRKATFSEYCLFSELSDSEHYSLDVVMEELGVRGCLELDDYVNIRKLNLSNTGIENYGFLKFFKKLKYLNLASNPLFYSAYEVRKSRNSYPLKSIKKVIYSIED